jgi:hypothetical protein
MLDINSALTDQMSFLPFGEVQRRVGSTASPFGYTGEQQAPAGMTYLRARFMDRNPPANHILAKESHPAKVAL